MKLWDVEIKKLKNEWLLKGKKQTKANQLASLICAIVISVGSPFLAVASVSWDEAILLFPCIVCIAFAIGMWINLGNCKKILKECDEEIEKRLESGRLDEKEVEEAFRPKTKEEKRSIAIKIGCFAVIFIIVLFIGISCSISKENRRHEYDDVFKKDPNNWSDDEKEYVNDLFDYMKENN